MSRPTRLCSAPKLFASHREDNNDCLLVVAGSQLPFRAMEVDFLYYFSRTGATGFGGKFYTIYYVSIFHVRFNKFTYSTFLLSPSSLPHQFPHTTRFTFRRKFSIEIIGSMKNMFPKLGKFVDKKKNKYIEKKGECNSFFFIYFAYMIILCLVGEWVMKVVFRDYTYSPKHQTLYIFLLLYSFFFLFLLAYRDRETPSELVK